MSQNFNDDWHSWIFHMDQTNVMDGNIVRVMSWYERVGVLERDGRHRVAVGRVM